MHGVHTRTGMNVKRSLRNCLGLHKVFDPYGAKNPGISPQVPRAPGFSAKKMSSGDKKEEEKGRAAEGEKERERIWGMLQKYHVLCSEP